MNWLNIKLSPVICGRKHFFQDCVLININPLGLPLHQRADRRQDLKLVERIAYLILGQLFFGLPLFVGLS